MLRAVFILLKWVSHPWIQRVRLLLRGLRLRLPPQKLLHLKTQSFVKVCLCLRILMANLLLVKRRWPMVGTYVPPMALLNGVKPVERCVKS
jgi:hypothetical protein